MATTGRSGRPTVAHWLPGSRMPRPRRATRRTLRSPNQPANRKPKGLIMNLVKFGAAVLAMATAFALPVGASAQSRGKVLVVMSSAHELDLRDGKHYETGYDLNEFVVPYRKLDLLMDRNLGKILV